MNILLTAEAMKLKLDWCSHEAAKYACEYWHYSKCIPKSKLVKIGVWENDRFIGVIIYSLGANYNLHRLFNLKTTEVCELTRIALNKHTNPVTKIVAISLKMLKKLCANLKLVVSYADRDQGHEGIIYKAGNWLRHGECFDEHYLLFGKKIHPKTVGDRYGTRSIPYIRQNIDPTVTKLKTLGKIRYIYKLDKRIEHESNAAANHADKSGAVPTDALHSTSEL